MKATIGVDLKPQDLQALTDQLNKAREEVEKRNPFTALGAEWKRLKAAIKDGKGLGSDEAKKATKDVASAVSESINLVSGTFNAVTDGLQKMGIAMDEETQAILGDLGGIMEGASQVAQGELFPKKRRFRLALMRLLVLDIHKLHVGQAHSCLPYSNCA